MPQLPTNVNHRRSSPRPDGATWRRSSGDITHSDEQTTYEAPAAAGSPRAAVSAPGAAVERHRHRAAMQPSDPPMTSWQPVDTNVPARDTVQVGRVRPELHAANPATDGGGPTGETGDGRSRKSVRSLIVGLLLLAAILAGAGVAALAMGATPAPGAGESVDGNSVDGGSVTGPPGRTESEATAGAAQPNTSGAGGAATAPTTQPSGPATLTAPAASVPLPSLADTAPASAGAPASVGAPATVSTLAPGDAGFGWPSTAFGSGP